MCQAAPPTNLFPPNHLKTLVNVRTQLPVPRQGFYHAHFYIWLLSVFISLLFVYSVPCRCYSSDVRDGHSHLPPTPTPRTMEQNHSTVFSWMGDKYFKMCTIHFMFIVSEWHVYAPSFVLPLIYTFLFVSLFLCVCLCILDLNGEEVIKLPALVFFFPSPH